MKKYLKWIFHHATSKRQYDVQDKTGVKVTYYSCTSASKLSTYDQWQLIRGLLIRMHNSEIDLTVTYLTLKLNPGEKCIWMPNFNVVVTPTMSRNIFVVIWKFGRNKIFEQFLSLFCNQKGILTYLNHRIIHFCVSDEIWDTKLFKLKQVLDA